MEIPMGSEPEPDAFRIETVRLGQTTLVAVHGELDLATAPQLRDTTATASHDIERLIIDLSQATFIDSVGICALVEAGRRSTHRGIGMVVITTIPSPALKQTRYRRPSMSEMAVSPGRARHRWLALFVSEHAQRQHRRVVAQRTWPGAEHRSL